MVEWIFYVDKTMSIYRLLSLMRACLGLMRRLAPLLPSPPAHPVLSFFLVKGYDLHPPVADNELIVSDKAHLPMLICGEAKFSFA